MTSQLSLPDFKASKHKANVRVFNKETSVFAAWKEDTKSSLKQATEIDFSEWKVDRVIKDEKDVSLSQF